MPQSLSRIYIHLIFSTKNRERNILPRFSDGLFKYMAGVFNQMGCPAIIVGGTSDHVHVLFCLSRTCTISEIVKEVKTSSTKWYKEKLGCEFSWQNGYGVFSVSKSKVEAVERYISNQEEHHRHKSFKEEYLAFLKSYGIDYDERYVWD